VEIILNKSDKRRVVYVVGSKPDPNFPDMIPDEVYFANAAVKTYSDRFNGIEKNLIISDQIFSNNETNDGKLKNASIGSLRNTREYIRGVKVDRLWVYSVTSRKNYHGKYKIIENIDDYIFYNKRECIYLDKIQWGILRLYSMKDFYKIIKMLKMKTFVIMIYKMLYKSVLSFMELSTGVLSLYIAINRNVGADIYLIGVGIDPNSGYSYSVNSKYSDYHIYNDILFLKNIIKQHSNSVTITDTTLRDLINCE
jgi:hypothetical protein